MSDMLKKFVGQELDSRIMEAYPHMQFPPCLYGRVVTVQRKGELYEAALRILDKNRQPDSRFPEIPKVVTDMPVHTGDLVTVVLLYGECRPYIIGRCF